MSQINTVSAHYLSHLSDDQIRDQIAKGFADDAIAKAFPGQAITAKTIDEALGLTGTNFEVDKRPIMTDVKLVNGEIEALEIVGKVATYRTDTGATLGVVGTDYGVVQFPKAFRALDVMARNGDLEIRSVQTIDEGRRVRVTALLGTTTMPSLDGAPNTLGHFAIFEAGHDGESSVTATVYTLRLECFNGMTSREVVKVHKVRHTSRAADRMDLVTAELLRDLLGDVAAEVAIFRTLAEQPMALADFTAFAHDLLGGELEEDASLSKTTRRKKAVEELEGYFKGGNEGAGDTAWGAYNSVTRWLEAKREGSKDAAQAAKRFESNVAGDGQKKAARALRILRAR